MEVFKNKEHSIYFGDVLDCLSKITSSSVKLIFTDPPYNIGKDFDGIADKKDKDDYKQWMGLWVTELNRVLDEDGSIYLMNSTQNLADMDLFCRKYFTILSRIVWAYDSSGVQAKKYFGSNWEPILHMVKNKNKYTFNFENILVEAKTGSQRNLIDYRKSPPQPYNKNKIPGNVWSFSRVRYKMEEYENHPTQKPEILLERIILASSNKGDLVLDPFSGSFTTSAVAKRLQRKSIGIELNESYIKIGLRRLSIPSNYDDKELKKNKKRKTKNKSKKDHFEQQNGDLFSIIEPKL
jgi:adenine-specific DNA-methyltransferase